MPSNFIACSICLRVQVGSDWIEAEQVIRANRTYELAAVPRLQAGLCERCADVITRRRGRVEEQLAA
jgi:hypothetical protein